MTTTLFREDSYLKECDATTIAVDHNAIILDRTIFYPMGGGQPGDTGIINWDTGSAIVLDTRYDDNGTIRHIVEEDITLPPPGEEVRAKIDWDRRYRHMRMHTCLHLLCAVVTGGVTGGSIGEAKGRLDFDLPDQALDKEHITAELNRLIEENHPLDTRWIDDAELAANPDLVRTMSVKPPCGEGRVRVIDIPGVDLQPCGGTHVNATGEIGRVRVGKIENKGRHNRRINVLFDE